METDDFSEKRSNPKKYLLMVVGGIVALVVGFASTFFGFIWGWRVLGNDPSPQGVMSLFTYGPFLGWAGLVGAASFITYKRGSKAFPFFAGGAIGVLLCLLVQGLCFAGAFRR